jgi:hypothetical protein
VTLASSGLVAAGRPAPMLSEHAGGVWSTAAASSAVTVACGSVLSREPLPLRST